MCRVSILVLVIAVIIQMVIAFHLDFEVTDPRQSGARKYHPYDSDEEYIRHIHSMMNAYRSDLLGGRLVIEQTNALVDTKYRTWKRNADIINSLLALPKSMNDAGR